jgi:hypothetical protein
MKKVKVVKENLHNLKENAMKTGQIPPDTVSLLSILKRIEAQTKAKFFAISNADELKDVFDYILDRVNPTLSSSTTQLRTALNQAVQSNLDDKKAGIPSNTSIKDKLKPAITKPVQEVLDEARVNSNKEDRVSYLTNALQHVWNMGKGNNMIDFDSMAESTISDLFDDNLDEAYSKKTPNKEQDIRERLKPAITKLVQEVLDEMGQE